MMIFRHRDQAGFLRRISKGVLERSSSTRRPNQAGQVVNTLDPNKFADKKQQRLHIGNRRNFWPYVALHNQTSLVRAMPPLYYDRLQANVVPETFPPDIKAFLYYFTLPERPRISAELRLRVASSDDSTSFESGYDLLGLDDQPWSRPLHVLSKFHIPLLYKKLREDRLVPDDLDAVLSTLPQKNFRYNHLYRPLYTLNDTFVIDFSGFRRLLIVVTEQGMTALEVVNLFSEVRTTLKTPYTGSALVRFERSTLPEHNGTRTVVLRYVKIITPVKCVIPFYDGRIGQPKEGELYERSRTRKDTLDQPLAAPVWGFNIDKPKGNMIPALRLLWDATPDSL